MICLAVMTQYWHVTDRQTSYDSIVCACIRIARWKSILACYSFDQRRTLRLITMLSLYITWVMRLFGACVPKLVVCVLSRCPASLLVHLIITSAHGFCRAMLCISAAYAVTRCPSVRPSVRLSAMFMSCVKTNKDIFEIFLPSRSQAILVFPCQTDKIR